MLTAGDKTPVEVDAYLIVSRDRSTGKLSWGGRITPVLGESLMPFLFMPDVRLYVRGRGRRVTITLLGEHSSEIQATGEPPWWQPTQRSS
jgi:hypothetical protein